MTLTHLCKLGGLFEAGSGAGTWSEALVAEKTHEQGMRVIRAGTHKPGGLEDTLLPDFLPADCRPYGWHDWAGKRVNARRERISSGFQKKTTGT